MTPVLKNTLKRVLYYSGYYHYRYRTDRFDESRLLVLMYHDLAGDDEAASIGRPGRREFDAHVAMLSRLFRIVTVEDAAEELRADGRLKAPSAAITFDDGYRSTLEIAWPVLKKYHASATVYLPTDWIDGHYAPWWLELKALTEALGTDSKAQSIVADALNTGTGRPVTIGDTSSGSLSHDLEQLLRDQPIETIRSVLEGIKTGAGISIDPDRFRRLALTWDEIRELADQGMRFGAHTCSHTNLATVDRAAAEAEIVQSQRKIAEQIGAPVTGFAYPYGKDTATYAELAPLLEKHGFTYAVTARFGMVDATVNRYLWGRTTLPSTTSSALLGRLLRVDYAAPIL